VQHYALAAQVFAVGLVFARVGAFLMLVPGIGETSVPPQIRLAFAFLLSLTLYPAVRGRLPAEPADLAELFGDIAVEIAIGLALAALLRMFLGAMLVTGEIISLQTTLSLSQTTNPLQAEPTASVGTFLSLLALTMVFATNLHQLFIGALVESYRVFGPGKGLPTHDLGLFAIQTFGKTFALGVQLSAPVMVFALVFNVATGFVARITPQFQVFYAVTPLTLLLGLSVFALSIGVVGLVWTDRLRAFAEQLI
jgi:flagellar biosynthetic protein FliR